MDDIEVWRVGAWQARRWWLALMTNAIGLVNDSAVLAKMCSYGRAQAMLVLAAEEVARAHFLYDAAQEEWSTPHDTDVWIDVPREVVDMCRPMLSGLQVAERYPAGMSTFWDPDDETGLAFPYSDSAPGGGEIKKQAAGFHVDRTGKLITSPMDIPEGALPLFITLVARGIEMHLAEDRIRHQSARPEEALDLAEFLHVEIFPFAWPEDLKSVLTEEGEKRLGAMTADRIPPPSLTTLRPRPAGWRRRR
ncbi:AbiV family abortive infection protein [Nocardioides islandensis]|uniref:AbiV family abortive infection protein n=1 Tax=Nocardioides islandensis TaxID=433663 RepID=A0A930VD58_9ACTN|nr:AbiV family abortive infection protein [Nocardioides islandensis]MBF4764372.1 AbiV family abortive infection protein [Nocardioides islandensis]